MIECLEVDGPKLLILLAILILEAWLGKTQKVKAGSILELVFVGIISLLILLTIKWRK